MAAKTVPVIGEIVPPIVDGGMVQVAKVQIGSVGSTGYDVDLGAEAATTPIFNVKAGTMVLDVLAKVVTAFTASAGITIGDSDDADGYMTTAELACTVISSEFRSSKSSSTLTNIYQNGKLYAADQSIDLVTGASTIVGQMDVYLVYSRVG